MTLGSTLDTLGRLRSSANVLNPGEGESGAGLGKGSVIPNLTLTASDRAVTSGSSDPDGSLAKGSAVRSRAPWVGSGRRGSRLFSGAIEVIGRSGCHALGCSCTLGRLGSDTVSAMSVDGRDERKEPLPVWGGDPRVSRGISQSSPTVDLWYSSRSMNSSILLRRSSSSPGPPPKTVEDEAGQADRAIEASTRLRSLCRLSSPWAAMVSMVNGVVLGGFSFALLCSGSF